MSAVIPTNSNRTTNATEIIRTTGGVQILLTDSPPTISLDTQTGTKIVMGATGVNIVSAGANIRIEGGVVTIEASLIKLEAGIVTARMIQCDTIVAGSVIGASYTPGAGNIW